MLFSLSDSVAEPELLMNVADGLAGWKIMHSLISALQRHQVKSLERSIEAGTSRDGFVIRMKLSNIPCPRYFPET